MLRPGFSLVGLGGVVMPTAPNVPPNCTTVWVDWASAGYTENDDLPPLVNVPSAHLEAAQTETLAENVRPRLGLVGANSVVENEATESAAAISDATVSQNADESAPDVADETRPRLRLL